MTYVGREIQKIGVFSVNFKWPHFTPQKRQKTESNWTWLHRCETKNHKNMHKQPFLTFNIDIFPDIDIKTSLNTSRNDNKISQIQIMAILIVNRANWYNRKGSNW